VIAMPTMSAASRRTFILSLGLAVLVGMIAWPSFVARIQYARTRAELAAIRDAAIGAELAPVGKLFTTLARVIGPAVVNVTSKRRVVTLADEIAALAGSVPQGASDESVGSGVLITSDGTLITNYHVVARSDEIDVASRPISSAPTRPPTSPCSRSKPPTCRRPSGATATRCRSVKWCGRSAIRSASTGRSPTAS
jgi:hypothetical protein